MRFILSAAVLGLLATTTPSYAGETPAEGETPVWYADFDKAVEAAKAQKKNLLVDFTGSDWCGWCIKLHNEVFDHAEFLEAARKSFILVALDFPHGAEAKAKVPNPQRNQELSKKYKVAGFPTILLLSTEGEVLGRTGYQKGGPTNYVEHLTATMSTWSMEAKSATELATAYGAAEGEAKTALFNKACEMVTTLKSSGARDTMKEIILATFKADPENKAGLGLTAAAALLKNGMATPDVTAAAKKLDSNNELGMLELIVQSQFKTVRDKPSAEAAIAALDELEGKTFKDKKIGFMLYFTATRWSAQMQNTETALELAEKALAIGSEEQRSIDFLNQLIAKLKPAEAEEVEDEAEEVEEEEMEEDEDEDDDSPSKS